MRRRGPAPSNVELAVDALRAALVDGHLSPGERIAEVPFAEQLGISRGPVREAFRLLEHDGLLTIIPNKGAVVPEITAMDVLEVYAMRASLGALALHKLMRSDIELPRAKLEEQLKRFARAVERGEAAQAVVADLSYQSAVVASAGLPRVARQFEQLAWQVRIFIAGMGVQYDDKLALMLEEVNALHRAISAHEGPEAERLWREKFERWVQDFLDGLGEEFDRDLWVTLTAGVSPTPIQRLHGR